MGLGSGVAGLLLERDKGLEARLLDGAVALDRDTGDDWVLGNGHGHATGGLAHADVGEEAGRVQRLDGAVGLGGVVVVADPQRELGAHRVGFDAFVADDIDRDDALGGEGRALRHDEYNEGQEGQICA